MSASVNSEPSSLRVLPAARHHLLACHVPDNLHHLFNHLHYVLLVPLLSVSRCGQGRVSLAHSGRIAANPACQAPFSGGAHQECGRVMRRQGRVWREKLSGIATCQRRVVATAANKAKYRYHHAPSIRQGFFIETALAAGQTLSLPDAVVRRHIQVLRLKEGDSLTLFNGQGGEYQASLLSPQKRDAGRPEITRLRHQPRIAHLAGSGTAISSGNRGMEFTLQKGWKWGCRRFSRLPPNARW